MACGIHFRSLKSSDRAKGEVCGTEGIAFLKRKIIGATVLFVLVVAVFFAAAIYFLHRNYGEVANNERAGLHAVMLNEVSQLTVRITENPNDHKAHERLSTVIIDLGDNYPASVAVDEMTVYMIIACAACVAFVAVVFAVCYVRIIKPFDKLEMFAKGVAKGNLDIPLEVQRVNIFGEFSWAFDMMRSELKALRESEEKAKQENKMLIATISHDIKTPVASIRAYAEGLQKGMDTSQERRDRYLDVIIRKSDEVAKLTNDLFLHALSDMEKLQLEVKSHDAITLIDSILDPLFAEYGDTIKVTDVPDIRVMADEKRLAQVFGNIVTNAVKYAPDSDIKLSFEKNDSFLVCEVRDFGAGIPAHDLPFVWNRFYRGANTEGISGSGLGLYIVKYIVEKCGGSVHLDSNDKGLSVVFSLPVCEPGIEK